MIPKPNRLGHYSSGFKLAHYHPGASVSSAIRLVLECQRERERH